ncbi:MAG: chlorite dismutase family protein [Hyphomicrobiaceae bacterium]
MHNRTAFVGGDNGNWRVLSVQAVCGTSLPTAARVAVVPASAATPATASAFVLHGLMSNLRYATRGEVTSLRARQEGLGRPQARCAALIPIKKRQAWWDLAQDERRAIFEAQSQHTAIGLDFLPAIARQLYHCRDLGEPFDFLTWFEYAPEHTAQFEDLVARLRATTEWTFVEREVDIRLERAL